MPSRGSVHFPYYVVISAMQASRGGIQSANYAVPERTSPTSRRDHVNLPGLCRLQKQIRSLLFRVVERELTVNQIDILEIDNAWGHKFENTIFIVVEGETP